MKQDMREFILTNGKSIWLDVCQVNSISEYNNSTVVTLVGDPDGYTLKNDVMTVLAQITNAKKEAEE